MRSSAAAVEVATITLSTPGTAAAARTTHARAGWPASGSRTFPGRRVEPIRAWMMATVVMASEGPVVRGARGVGDRGCDRRRAGGRGLPGNSDAWKFVRAGRRYGRGPLLRPANWA